MAEKLGNPFAVVSPGINVKKYPTCYCTHPALDAMMQLIGQYDLKPQDIESVDCQVPLRYLKILFYEEPTSDLEGKFSMPFTLAVALTDRKVGLAQVTNEKVKDPRIKELEQRIKMRAYPDSDEKEAYGERPDIVTVKLKNGKEYSSSVLKAKGHADVPLTMEDLLEKYRECARLVLRDKDVERTIDLVGNLDKIEKTKELADIITGTN